MGSKTTHISVTTTAISVRCMYSLLVGARIGARGGGRNGAHIRNDDGDYLSVLPVGSRGVGREGFNEMKHASAAMAMTACVAYRFVCGEGVRLVGMDGMGHTLVMTTTTATACAKI